MIKDSQSCSHTPSPKIPPSPFHSSYHCFSCYIHFHLILTAPRSSRFFSYRRGSPLFHTFFLMSAIKSLPIFHFPIPQISIFTIRTSTGIDSVFHHLLVSQTHTTSFSLPFELPCLCTNVACCNTVGHLALMHSPFLLRLAPVRDQPW